jgi:hypothetical protein
MRKTKRITTITWTTKKVNENPFSEALYDFHNSMLTLRGVNESLPQWVKPMAEQKQREYVEALKKLSPKERKQVLEFAKITGPGTRKLSGTKAELVYERLDALIFERSSVRLVRDMTLVYLIVSFEDFLEDLLATVFGRKPESMATKSKNVTFEQICKSKTLEDLLSELSELEIRSCLNQDIYKVNEYFSDHFKIEIRECAPDWKKFAERFYRRNILVHNSGMVDEIYRTKTGYKGPDVKLMVTETYLSKSIQLFEKTAMELAKEFNDKYGKGLPKWPF